MADIGPRILYKALEASIVPLFVGSEMLWTVDIRASSTTDETIGAQYVRSQRDFDVARTRRTEAHESGRIQDHEQPDQACNTYNKHTST